ncbi:hypothetical protein [Streptomyces collinus]|uniref:hypothetical protein n=1 Tax=Streptomyces collinus TaxID=42684 RepID=UPI0033C4F148
MLGPVKAKVNSGITARVLPTSALLTLDGRWIESGGPDYRREFNAYLDALPPEAMVVRVLYHS